VAALKAASPSSSRATKAREMIKNARKLEPRRSQLNRDYAINKKNYEDLVSRRESADCRVTRPGAGVADFRLIDPPGCRPSPVRRTAAADAAGDGARARRGLVHGVRRQPVAPGIPQRRELRKKIELPRSAWCRTSRARPSTT